jgi:hypothetical protein
MMGLLGRMHELALCLSSDVSFELAPALPHALAVSPCSTHSPTEPI